MNSERGKLNREAQGQLKTSGSGKGEYEREDYLGVDSNLIPFGSLFSRSYTITLSSASVRHKVKGPSEFPNTQVIATPEEQVVLSLLPHRLLYSPPYSVFLYSLIIPE
ncbi:hypothetical protein Salmi_Mp096 (mitochondrion) [Salvia miltiorrhiza]|uniref:Uncharacterized protein n=1 Tax=Salvia miltiorrhiza TaxID=226208 RepID=V9P590_SALMI|nr:hypothetical protein Salmi_Mp096 [Salvia miltiorrhiza]AGU16624.1 hypothetical protein Salmi_Mp096 [Salvia miltiorrhiza]